MTRHFYFALPVVILFFIYPLGLVAQGLTPQTPEQAAAKKRLYAIFEAEQQFRRQDNQGYFADVSPAAEQKRAAFWQSLLDSLQQVPERQLTPDDQINLAMFRFVLEDRVAEIRFEAYLIPFNAEGGFYNSLSFWSGRRFTADRDAQRYLERLKAFPKYMRANMNLLQLGIQKKIVAPRVVAQNYEVLIAPFLEPDPQKHLLYEPLKNLPETWSESMRRGMQSEGAGLIRDSVLAVYREFDRFMKEKYLPASRPGVGISEIPNGKAYYAQRVAYFTTLPMTPDEVFQTGQREVARIRSEMESIIREVGFEGSYAEFLHFLRTDPRFYAKEPKELLKEASYIAKKIDGKLPQYFSVLPRLPYGVQPVPAAIAPNYTGGRYSPGSARDHRAGNYWVNTYKLESRPLYVLPALTLHEAVPGHHLQIALAEELEGQPEFRRNTYLSAFGEGWGLYSEWLGKEMGIYETPYEQFGRLTYEMWRACRLVVDVGMHDKGWTRQQALDFLSSNTALSLHECETEINRYIGWPGQAVSYKIGELKIRELRRRAEEALKDRFNIREFHHVILRNGAVPLFILEKEVEKGVGR